MRISITVSDPWELGEALKWQQLPGELLVNDKHGGRTVIKLDEAINYGDSNWRYVVVTPRNPGDEIARLQAGKKILGSFTGITVQQGESQSPLDLSTWRGGLAFTGDIESAN